MRTAYLDTANWIDLASNRVDQHTLDTFERAVASCRIAPVLSLAHLIEFAGTEDSGQRAELTEYLERFDSIGQVRWIKHLYDVIPLEAVASFGEVFSRWTPPGVFTESFPATLRDYEHWKYDLDIRWRIHDLVEMVREDHSFVEGLAEDRRAYPGERLLVARTRRARNAPRFSEAEFRRWIAEALPKQVDLTSGTYGIDDEMKVSFSERADLDRCPAFLVDQAWHEGWNLDPAGASGSDIADCLHVPGIAYCDVAFADKRTAEALRKGRSPKRPRKNSEFGEWVDTLGTPY
ncbi:hypothetical protein [Candidatus Palauibacter sp.]|uniref:hypothetical protein n=1 Tax=Candidatus Palauibacter sp. TaxID=3101350 RepID=UPI003B018D06